MWKSIRRKMTAYMRTMFDLPLLEVSKPPYQGFLAAHPSNLKQNVIIN